MLEQLPRETIGKAQILADMDVPLARCEGILGIRSAQASRDEWSLPLRLRDVSVNA